MLGQRIRAKRKERGKSLSQLSALTGLTASFLSQVERDVTEPSITSLRKIAKALDVPIFYFLLDTEEYSPVVRAENRKVLRFPHSHLMFELLTPDLNRQMEMMMATLEPNTSTCEEPLGHPGEEYSSPSGRDGDPNRRRGISLEKRRQHLLLLCNSPQDHKRR